jgi:hypothetical protein
MNIFIKYKNKLFSRPINVGGGTPPPVASISTANLMQTGQTTSYRTGDDISRGRLTDFFTLEENNPFGNTDRFTDLNGLQVYSNSIIIDWSTLGNNDSVLLYYIGDALTYRNWATAIDLHLSSTIGGLTGWNLWNVKEVVNVCNIANKPYRMNYAPFNFGASQRYFHTSSDYDGTNVFITDLGAKITEFAGKASSYLTTYVRYTTLTELGL